MKFSIANRSIILSSLVIIILIISFSLKIKPETTFSKFISESPAKIITVNNQQVISGQRDDPKTPMGLGFFRPEFFKNPKLYFYDNPDTSKTAQDNVPADSLVFKDMSEFKNYELIYAPPWLMPEHNKPDYDIFYFRLQSVGRDFLEVTLNSETQKTGYVDRNAGEIIYWPDFLLRIHSVEFPPGKDQKVRFKPLPNAGEVNAPFDFMRPLLVQDEWMSVELFDEMYNKVGEGWIQWRQGDELLIEYSLLS